MEKQMTKKDENELSDAIINKIKELKKSPVYNMSLSDKELFHSNFWWWLMTTYKDLFVPVFFPGLDIRKVKEENITREENHCDIMLKYDAGKKYIIENKFKSLPTKEQLENYSTIENFEKGYLISFIKPTFLEENEKWKYISYNEIIDKLKSKLNNIKLIFNFFNKKTKYHKSIINDYINMLKKIFDILSSILTESFKIEKKVEIKKGEICCNDDLGNAIYNPNIGFDRRLISDSNTKKKNESIENENEYYFKDRTFEYLSKKLQMFAFAQYMEKDENFKELKNLDWKIKDIGIGNKGKDKALISFEKEIPNTNPKLCIGIQIEGDDYRYYVAENLDVITTKDGKTEKQNKIKKGEEEKKLIEKLYNIYPTWIKIGVCGNRNKIDDNNNSCNKFNQNPYFVYKYKTIIDEKNENQEAEKYTMYIKTFEDLKEQILEDIEEANKIINYK